MNFIQKAESRKGLEGELYDIANHLVGNVGPDADHNYFKSRWHAFAFFCIQRRSPDYAEIFDTWIKWIKAYCDFKKLHVPEAARLMENPDLIVRWLQRPVIEFGTDFKYEEGKQQPASGPENFSWVYIRAYLAIHRTDCEPNETVVICPRCKEMDEALGGASPS